jgi:quercetin dioxygenase-like cupin family protein
MRIRHYRDVKATEPMPGFKKRIVIGPDEGAQNFIMRVFEVAPGFTGPNHSHAWEHEIFILAGEGAVRNKQGENIPFQEGYTIFLPAGETHCLVNNGKELLRFICIIPTGVE